MARSLLQKTDAGILPGWQSKGAENAMKMIIGYVRAECGSRLMRKLHDAGVGGLSAYSVRGMSGETPTFLHSKRPYELDRLPETLKLEIICEEGAVDGILALIAGQTKTGRAGDGWICIQNIERVHNIRDLAAAPS